jgi:hypothetical protein
MGFQTRYEELPVPVWLGYSFSTVERDGDGFVFVCHNGKRTSVARIGFFEFGRINPGFFSGFHISQVEWPELCFGRHIFGIQPCYKICTSFAKCIIPIQKDLFMSRISIDVTTEEHQRLKAMAALQGKSIKDYVIERTLGLGENTSEAAALKELEVFLDTRIRSAQNGAVSQRTVGEIFRRASRERKGK